MFEMQKIKRKKIELVGAHRALEFYGLNEGIDNHITTKDWFHTTRCWKKGRDDQGRSFYAHCIKHVNPHELCWRAFETLTKKVKIRIRERSWCRFNDSIWCLLVGCNSWPCLRNWSKNVLYCPKPFVQMTSSHHNSKWTELDSFWTSKKWWNSERTVLWNRKSTNNCKATSRNCSLFSHSRLCSESRCQCNCSHTFTKCCNTYLHGTI